MTHEDYREYEQFVYQFKTITSNLWYTWDTEAQKLVDVLLSKSNHSLSSYQRFYTLPDENRQELFRNTRLRASVDHVYRALEDYLSRSTWFDQLVEQYPEYEVFNRNPIAYLCAEYGLTDWLKIYAGGLGVLAGDMLKEASDLGLPVVAVGLFYQYGYFSQKLDEYGYQQEEYPAMDPTLMPLTQVRISTGAPLLIEVTIVDHPVYCRIWTAQIGRVSLYLLDTNIAENTRMEDKLITGYLYGGDQDTRIRQEIVLGIGGERALSTLGYHPTVFSMNEGHSAFAALEITKHFMHERGMSFVKAREETKTRIIYTNHTLVPAGNDVFEHDLVQKYLSPYLYGMSINFETLYDLGRTCDCDGNKISDTFSMPNLAFEMSVRANAVSKQHGEVAQKMWPTRDIIPITNGVHLPTWVHPHIKKLYDEHISPDWMYTVEDHELWQHALKLPLKELWEAHQFVKQHLLMKLNQEYGFSFSSDVLTITWVRRFTPYKRPDLIFSDIERLFSIVSHSERPVQIIIGGKAHPHDTSGKDTMNRIFEVTQQERFKGRVGFLPNYEISLARLLVGGSDVWLNTPIPLDEASGTSGMKAAANGVLQFSTNGGWVAEVDWKDKSFIIDGEDHAVALYTLLQTVIAPVYYTRNGDMIPEGWVEHMRKTIATVCPEFSTKRTLKEYFERLYTIAMTKQH